MPVTLENHNPDLDLTLGTTKSDIVAFLYTNDEYGHGPKEIHNEIAIPHNTAKVTLKRLYDSDYIDKTPDGYYHVRTDRKKLYRYTAALDGLDRMFATYDEDATDKEPAETSEIDSAELSDESIEDAVAIGDKDSDQGDL